MFAFVCLKQSQHSHDVCTWGNDVVSRRWICNGVQAEHDAKFKNKRLQIPCNCKATTQFPPASLLFLKYPVQHLSYILFIIFSVRTLTTQIYLNNTIGASNTSLHISTRLRNAATPMDVHLRFQASTLHEMANVVQFFRQLLLLSSKLQILKSRWLSRPLRASSYVIEFCYGQWHPQSHGRSEVQVSEAQDPAV